MSKEFETVPEHLTDEEKIKFAQQQIRIGNDNPFGLTDKMKAFADYYMYSGDVTISGLRAGYSQSTIGQIRSTVLVNPSVKLYLRLLYEINESDGIADTDEVLTFLTTVMRGEVFEPTKVGIGKGEERVQYVPPKVTERIRAGELLGRRYSAFNEKLDLTLQAPVFTGSDDIEE